MPVDYEVTVRAEKAAAVQEIKERLGRSAAVLLTEYRGLTVTQLAALRRALQAARVEYRVVKNTLTKRAAAELGISGLDAALEGPTALAYCFEDPVAAAKALASFAREHPALVLKGGLLGSRPLSADEARALSTVDPLDLSLAKICGSLTSSLAAVVGVLEAPLSRIVYVLERVSERGE